MAFRECIGAYRLSVGEFPIGRSLGTSQSPTGVAKRFSFSQFLEVPGIPFNFFPSLLWTLPAYPIRQLENFVFFIFEFNAVVVHFTSCLCARFELSPDLPFIDLVLSNFCFKVRYVTSLFAICLSAKSPFSETSEMVQRSYMRDHRMSSPLMICLIIKKCLLY